MKGIMFSKKCLIYHAAFIGLLLLIQFAFAEADNNIHIAAVADMSGKDNKAGESLVRGINLYLDEINENGGINGKQVVLDLYDDQNDSNLAREKAYEIVRENRAIAVIGHHYSSCSINAGEIYKENGIPAITPYSTVVDVTHNNDWYFRNTFNDDLQGSFLANYVNKIINKDRICVIQEDLPYGSFLADVFIETSRSFGIEMEYNYRFEVHDPNLDDTLKSIIDELKASDFPGVIFLSTHAAEGVKLIKLIKDADLKNFIVVPAAYASESFYLGFSEFPKEKHAPGYYSNGVYVSSPLLYDSADETTIQFKEKYTQVYDSEPDWRPAFAYDAVKIIVDAITNTEITVTENTISGDRQKIKDYMLNMNDIKKAVHGVTGYNYFNEYGDRPKPIYIGMYRNGRAISALTQFREIKDIHEIYDMNKAEADGKVTIVEGRYLYKTDVVYTAITLNEIIKPNFLDYTCILDFDLWFRYTSDIDVENIEFLNAIGNIELGNPIEDYVNREFSYRRYNVKGEFKTDFFSIPPPYGQHILGITFRHRELTRNNLIFVTDLVGMGITEDSDPIERMKEHQVLSPGHGWLLDKVRIYQDLANIATMGRPEFINIAKGSVDYSRFNFGILVKEDTIGVRTALPSEQGLFFLFFSGGVTLIIFILSYRIKSNLALRTIWIFQSVFSILLLLSAEAVLLRGMAEFAGKNYLNIMRLIFDISWWFIPAYLIVIGIDRFIWKPLEDNTQQIIPTLIRRAVATIIFSLAFFAVIAFVLEFATTGLLATIVVLVIIIGLLIKVNISDVIAGIAINVERSFRIGDWIKIDTEIEGHVIDITWRTTRIETFFGNIISLPNSKASEAVIENYDQPESLYWAGFTIHVEPQHSPDTVKEILTEAALDTDGIVGEPWIRLMGVTSWSTEFWVRMQIDDMKQRYLYTEKLWKSCLIHLEENGVKPAVQRHEVKMISGWGSAADF